MGSRWMEGLGDADCCHNPALASCLEIIGNDNGKIFGPKLISDRANNKEADGGFKEKGKGTPAKILNNTLLFPYLL